MTYEEFKKKHLSDKELKKEYEALEPEYQLIKTIILEREKQNLSKVKR